jgi:hypothetical protein
MRDHAHDGKQTLAYNGTIMVAKTARRSHSQSVREYLLGDYHRLPAPQRSELQVLKNVHNLSLQSQTPQKLACNFLPHGSSFTGTFRCERDVCVTILPRAPTS